MKKKDIDRRKFLKILGAGAVTTTAAMYGCKSENHSATTEHPGNIPTDKMTYRTNPTTGDHVSLLGYGCMRLPTVPTAQENGDDIDQEMVNKLTDYALAHGVNYFDKIGRASCRERV